MIERDIVSRQIKEFQIMEYIGGFLGGAGFSHATVKRTPLGEKIIIHTSRPGMVVGRSGKNIKDLTEQLKIRFKLENPQVEIAEVGNPQLNASIVAERIATSLERYGSNKFKSIIHKAVEETIATGALGIEVLLSGKIPSARARTWRVSAGYLKKCGEPALQFVDISYKIAKLKSGVVGIIVSIMPPGIVLPDSARIREPSEIAKIETAAVKEEEPKAEAPAKPAEPKPRKRKPKKENEQELQSA